nr:MAG TPA: Protein of unknown function (DUF3102) [Caudoviricetes sp.]
MKEDYVIAQNAETGSLYAAFRDRFWLWDKEKRSWVLSPWAESQYTADRKKELAQSKQDWLANGSRWLFLDDYEVPDKALKALQTTANPTQAAPASHADAGAATQSPCAAAPASSAAEPAAFDYTGLDSQTVADLHLAEQEFSAGKKLAEIGLRRMADGVAIAHEALCGTIVHKVDNGRFAEKDDTFRRWCEIIGVGKTTAYKLLQVAQLFDASSPQQQKILQELSPSLLYAAAKPSAPAEAVAAVKAGDITTHKEYQEMVARLKSETARADAAERDARSEKDRRSAAETRLDAVLADLDAERRRADEAEARPIEVAVQQPGEADLAKYYAEGERRAREKLAAQIDSADRAAAKYKTDNAKLRSQLSGKSDHLAAVEKELAKLKAQLAGYRSSEPVALVRCCDCAYESRCCGLGMLDMPEDELEKLQLALTACAAGKRKN